MIQSKDMLRTSVLAEFVKRAPSAPGRTGLMKFAYLLQSVRNVPLGYRFRLYNYGPYDEQVLADANEATSVGLLESKLVTYQRGYGYEFSLGDSFEESEGELKKLALEFDSDIDWVIKKFGHESASRLELISTIVFALCDKQRRRDPDELKDRVHEIKPHFSKEVIAETIEEISAEVLDCITCK